MTVRWTILAKESYNDEVNFIFRKWNYKEVEKFIELIDDYVSTLETGMFIGLFDTPTKCHRVMVSKQTTLFYRYNFNKEIVELLLFWNKQKDPKTLKAILANL